MMTSSRRWVPILCALGAAAAFALAVQGSLWWTIGDEVGIGTVSSEHCFGEGVCRRSGLNWTGGSATWVRAGAATYAGGLVAALLLVTVAGALTARASGRLAAMSAAVATVTVAVVGAIFIATRPDVPGTELARGPVLFALAVVLAAVAITLTFWPRGRPVPAPRTGT